MILETLVKGLIAILLLMLSAAYMTYLERIVMARLQLRLGPVRVGPLGLLQPIADGIKLLVKERFQPLFVDPLVYWLAPALSLCLALSAFVLIPVGGEVTIGTYTISLHIATAETGIVFLLALSSLAVYGTVLAGWGSNNRYSLLGGLRSTAQMISYEIPMALAILTIVLSAGTLDLNRLVEAQKNHWFIWTHPISFLIYLITAFAETNRAPFDLPEAEHELTGGYHTEYGGMKFAVFFMAEYINMVVVSAIAATLFFGGWLGPGEWPIIWFVLKVAVFLLIFMWVRATMARLRYNQLLSFSWKVLMPVSVLNLCLTAYCVLI